MGTKSTRRTRNQKNLDNHISARIRILGDLEELTILEPGELEEPKNKENLKKNQRTRRTGRTIEPGELEEPQNQENWKNHRTRRTGRTKEPGELEEP